MKQQSIPFELKDVLSGLTGSGKIRSILILNQKPGEAQLTLDSLCTEVLAREPHSYKTILGIGKLESPIDLLSQFARNLRTGRGDPIKLARFARDVGKSISSLRPDGKELRSYEESRRDLADSLAQLFGKLIVNSPKLLLCFDQIDEFPDDLLDWIAGELNQAIRAVPQFKNTRFLFTASKHDQRLDNFFNQFGFEKVRTYHLQPPESIGSRLTKIELSDKVNNPVLSKRLINEKNSPKLEKEFANKVSTDQQDVKNFMSSFTEDEKIYLSALSYPKRASRYSLEHFVDSRTAALAYNWLKRSPCLRSVHESGDLVLSESVRNFARTYHASQDPQSAVKRNEISSVLDLFFDQFPCVEDHKIAINLQAFSQFNQKLLNQLFNKDEQSEIELFIKRNEDSIIEDGKTFVLSDDAKLVTRRYMEVSERLPLPGLLDRVREIWLEDQEHFSRKKSKLDQEKKNLTLEIEDTLQQIVKLKELKDKLLEDFKSPKRFNREKEYSFSTSKALIFLGLATCGASVMFESLGAYHAACGLAVTLFGFFWPNVELKKATATDDGPRSNLAIETQQRSLKHRIAGLGNRTGVMKSNLDELDKQMESLGETPPPPYLELAEEID
jgi:hypothetical protein